MDIFCLQDQSDQPAIKLLSATAKVSARLMPDLVRQGWPHPLVVLGDALLTQDGRSLVRHAPRAAAPLLILPPLPAGDATVLVEAAAPVTVVRRRADTLEVADDELRGAR